MTSSTPLSPGAHTFEYNGITFAYTVSGAGPVLVVQSVGWGPSANLYRTGLQPLEAYLTMVYFEPRANGFSTRPADASQMGTKHMAGDLDGLRQHLGLEAINLLGHSNGGAISLAFAQQHPSRVAKLVLTDTQLMGFDSNNFGTFAAKRQDHPVYGPALKMMFSLMAQPPATDEELTERLVKALPYYLADTEKTGILAEQMKGPVSVWAFEQQRAVDAVEPCPHVAELGKVTAQTLVTVGEEDAMCSVAAAEAIRDGVQGSKLIVYKGCGHMPWIEAKEQYLADVADFINS